MRKIDLSAYSAYLCNSKPINTRRSSNTTPICVLVVMVILLAGVAFYFLQHTTRVDEFYFVQVGEFMNYSSAQKLSEEIQKKQAAGYIHFDGRYHVFASFYPLKEDAEKVVESLKGDYPNSTIYILEATKFKNKANLKKEENSAIQESLKENLIAINGLYNQTMSFDKAEINEKRLSLNVQEILSDYKKNLENFKNSLKNHTKFEIFNGYLTKISISLNDCIDHANKSESAFIKYEIIKMVVNHSAFLDCF